MSNKIITLAKFFDSSSLITRQAAQEVFSVISESPEKVIILDFSQIKFASRSFFDELNNLKSKISLLGKRVEFVNLNDHITKLFQLVVNAEKSKSSMSYSSVANAEMITI